MSEQPAQPTVDRGGRRALWLGTLAIVLVMFFSPLGLVTGVGALVAGVRARRRAKRNRAIAPGAVAGITMGSIGLALSVLSLIVTTFLWTEMSGLQRCLNGANTHADRQTCQQVWFPKIEKKLHMPPGSMSRFGGVS